jgi:hypothetical protein
MLLFIDVTSLKGKFRPRNPLKYSGDPREIIFRSSWEQLCMKFFDLNENVQSWSSEEKSISYYDPVAKKYRRYFPDFIVKFINSGGEMITEMIEVKPKKEVIGPPKNPKRRTKAWATSVHTYITNLAKWKAAEKYCKERGWAFRIITEDDLFRYK